MQFLMVHYPCCLLPMTIYSMRLHYPVEIQFVSSQENEKLGCLAYINGVVLYSKLKAKCVCFRGITGCLVPKLPARKEELREFLEKRNIVYSRNDNVKQLKEQASRYIKNRKDDLRNEQCIVIQGVKVMAATKTLHIFYLQAAYTKLSLNLLILKSLGQ